MELKDVTEEFSVAHDTFTKEFPDAKAEEVTTPEPPASAPATLAPETPPAAPAAPAEAPPATEPEKPAEAPKEGEKPAEPEAPAEAPKPEEEKKAEAVAERLLRKYTLEDFVRREHRSKIGRLVLQEDRSLTPKEVERAVSIIYERVDI